MKQIHFPNPERVREIFDYHPDGKLIWKKRPTKYGTKIKIGEQAGYLSNKYRRINFDKTPYYEHVVVWAYHNDTREEGTCIDHIDGDPLNNRIENLREVSLSQNMNNSVLTIRNRTGYRGVYKRFGQYGADIRFAGKLYHLGFFTTPEEAHEAYMHKHKEFYGDLPEKAQMQRVREPQAQAA